MSIRRMISKSGQFQRQEKRYSDDYGVQKNIKRVKQKTKTMQTFSH